MHTSVHGDPMKRKLMIALSYAAPILAVIGILLIA
ncbi:hypothetical protein J2747_000353 [Thermococcus stetteri]|nr:hypothetical protein [Thermococcus stetteri]